MACAAAITRAWPLTPGAGLLLEVPAMGKQFPSLDASHRDFVRRQRIFFAASAAPGARVNVSPRGADAFAAVLDGAVDIAIATPTAAGAMLVAGSGPLAMPGAGRLRALGTLPQRDRLVVCADAALGQRSAAGGTAGAACGRMARA